MTSAQRQTAIKIADGLAARHFYLDPLPGGAALMTVDQPHARGKWTISPDGELA